MINLQTRCEHGCRLMSNVRRVRGRRRWICLFMLALLAPILLFLLVVPSTKAPSLPAVPKLPDTSEHARLVGGLLG